MATFLALGPLDLRWRAIGLVLAALWLAADVWEPVLRWKWRWKFIVGWTATSALLIGAMLIMAAWLVHILEGQRNEVYQVLSAAHYLEPGAEDDPMHTMFSVTNGSSFTISGRHQIICETVLAVGNHGTSPVSNVTSGFVNGVLQIGNITRMRSGVTLESGGDAQTEPCLRFFKFINGSDCADVRIIFWYSLENQPDVGQEKKFRFVANKGKSGIFSWQTQPVNARGSYCWSFLSTEIQQRLIGEGNDLRQR